MPELPEVEVLVRHLRPRLRDKTVRQIRINRVKVIAPTPARHFGKVLRGAKFHGLFRRGKYLVFTLRPPGLRAPFLLVGHLGMTGRMYLLPATAPLPKHAAVVLDLGRENFVFEDTRYFGRLTLDAGALDKLGPEPLSVGFTAAGLRQSLKRSTQPIKVKLLDQSLLAGIGNIYASEALFRARVAPTLPARRLTKAQAGRLWRAIREVLGEAVEFGSTVPLSYSGGTGKDRLFYYGRAPGTVDFYEERLRVYDRAGRPCLACRAPIRRLAQAGRSTYYCPRCQRR